MLTCLTCSDLPADKKQAQRVVLESKCHCIENTPCFLVGIVLLFLPLALMEEGHFAGHLSQYDRLRRYVWWCGMNSDVHDYC